MLVHRIIIFNNVYMLVHKIMNVQLLPLRLFPVIFYDRLLLFSTQNPHLQCKFILQHFRVANWFISSMFFFCASYCWKIFHTLLPKLKQLLPWPHFNKALSTRSLKPLPLHHFGISVHWCLRSVNSTGVFITLDNEIFRPRNCSTPLLWH